MYILKRYGSVGGWGRLNTYLHAISLSLLLSTSLFELHATHVHHSGGDFVYVILFFLSETQYIEGLLYG
jgi:hypothetical protein